MTWEEAVVKLRSDDRNMQLIKDAYFLEDLTQNVENFRASDEFQETMFLINNHFNFATNELNLLDVGAGNGIASLGFGIEKMNVTALEPDPSETVGNGAIKILKHKYHLANLSIQQGFMEDSDLPEASFDIVYGRQVMHHAYDLKKFALSCYRLVKPGGLLITCRDHIAENEEEKNKFLNKHPLHKFYGGENAFSAREYQNALSDAGFKIMNFWEATDSIINTSPWNDKRIDEVIRSKFGKYASNPFSRYVAKRILYYHLSNTPGRLCTIICTKE